MQEALCDARPALDPAVVQSVARALCRGFHMEASGGDDIDLLVDQLWDEWEGEARTALNTFLVLQGAKGLALLPVAPDADMWSAGAIAIEAERTGCDAKTMQYFHADRIEEAHEAYCAMTASFLARQAAAPLPPPPVAR